MSSNSYPSMLIFYSIVKDNVVATRDGNEQDRVELGVACPNAPSLELGKFMHGREWGMSEVGRCREV